MPKQPYTSLCIHVPAEGMLAFPEHKWFAITFFSRRSVFLTPDSNFCFYSVGELEKQDADILMF